MRSSVKTPQNPLARTWRQGNILPLLSMEIKAVSRNPFLALSFSSNVILAGVLVFLLFYREHAMDRAGTLWAMALLAAIPSMNYATFCFAKDGLYYQGYMTRLSVSDYARWKVLFMHVYSLGCSVLLLPFILRGEPWMIFTFWSFVVYYMGFGGILMLYVSSFDRNKIRLSAAPIFNAQGVSLWKVLFVMPVTTPLFFFQGVQELAVWLTLLLGAGGLFLTKASTAIIGQNLAKRKHRYLAL